MSVIQFPRNFLVNLGREKKIPLIFQQYSTVLFGKKKKKEKRKSKAGCYQSIRASLGQGPALLGLKNKASKRELFSSQYSD
jgi:hypothetical protein